METKHTAGPWQMMPEEADKDYIRVRGTKLGGRYKIANVPTPVYDGVHSREVAETRANAALIASAPELLRVLMALYDHGYTTCTDHDMVRAVIAKATGDKDFGLDG